MKNDVDGFKSIWNNINTDIMISESYYSSDYKSLSNTTKLRKAKNKVRDGQFQMGKLEELINQKGKLGIDYPRKKEKSFQFSDRQINNHKSTNLYEQNRTKISTLTFKNDVLIIKNILICFTELSHLSEY